MKHTSRVTKPRSLAVPQTAEVNLFDFLGLNVPASFNPIQQLLLVLSKGTFGAKI